MDDQTVIYICPLHQQLIAFDKLHCTLYIFTTFYNIQTLYFRHSLSPQFWGLKSEVELQRIFLCILVILIIMANQPMSVATGYRAWFCGNTSVGISGSNPARPCCLSLENIVYCQVQLSATGWSRVQRSPTRCGMCLRVITWNTNPVQCRFYFDGAGNALKCLGWIGQNNKERKKAFLPKHVALYLIKEYDVLTDWNIHFHRHLRYVNVEVFPWYLNDKIVRNLISLCFGIKRNYFT